MHSCIALNIQPWRENDWLVDAFSAQGRTSLIVKAPPEPPQLFTEYHTAFKPQILATAKIWQPQQQWPLAQQALYCGLYLNELLYLLLPEHEPATELYQQYQSTLSALANTSFEEPWLRLFEMQLLHTLGYGFAWESDSLGRPILPSDFYAFAPGQGFQRQPQAHAQAFLGADLLAFHAGSNQLNHWRMARRVMRQALAAILPRPLISRELLNPAMLISEKSYEKL